MWVSVNSLRRGLYAEHHDELGFLYRQIAHHREEGTLSRERLAEFEWRLVAHLDGLVLGATLAWREIGARHDDDDAGHWYAAGLLACVQREDTRFAALLQRATHNAAEPAAPALADALRHAMPSDWSGRLLGWLAEVPQPMLGWLAEVASYQLPGCRQALERRLQTGVPPSVEWVRALGRSGAVEAAPWLLDLAQSAAGPAELRRAALLALAELGAPQILVLVRRAASESALAHPVLGLVGARQDVQVMLRSLEAAPAAETALGLGLLGDLSAAYPLVAALRDEAIGAAAAAALDWITGAGLWDAVSGPGDDGERTADGSDRYQRLRPGASVVPRTGPVVQQISRDPTRWTRWLEEAAPRFRAGLRYRFGRVYSAPWLVQTLADDALSSGYRRWAGDELSIRLAAPQRLDPRASVARQRSTLQQLGAWATALGEQYAADSWMRAGLAS